MKIRSGKIVPTCQLRRMIEELEVVEGVQNENKSECVRALKAEKGSWNETLFGLHSIR